MPGVVVRQAILRVLLRVVPVVSPLVLVAQRRLTAQRQHATRLTAPLLPDETAGSLADSPLLILPFLNLVVRALAASSLLYPLVPLVVALVV